jgi:hypothetical protein
MLADVYPRKIVAVHPASLMAVMTPLLDVLAALFPVRFAARDTGTAPADALWILDGNTVVAERSFASGLPVLDTPTGHQEQELARACAVQFIGNPVVQPFLLGLKVNVTAAGAYWPFRPAKGDNVIAVSDQGPLWTERQNNGVVFRRAATGVPPLSSGQPVFPLLLRGGWIRWLPLFHFLRQLTAEIDWQPNRLQACFMFDDPNLHWPSWGFLDYRALANHAREHHYHASMATVPLDLWFTHSRTAALFREQSRYLSLLVHGVEHTCAEMLRPRPAGRRLADLHWGLEKLKELEARHGLRISRVMAPPHHACSLEAADLMLQAGYEAACVAWLLLMRGNPRVRWRPDFGLRCAEFLGEGFPVLPRFNFAGQDPGRAVLAAFFHQPIIMIGHHQDVAGGLGVLADWARWVNSLGDVRWTSLEEIIHSSFLTQRVNGTLFIKLGARKIHLCVPEGVDQIVLLRPWVSGEATEPVSLIRHGSVSRLPAAAGICVGPCPVRPGEQLTVVCEVPQRALPRERSAALRLWPLTRRLACEVRDRLWPLVRSKPRIATFRFPTAN